MVRINRRYWNRGSQAQRKRRYGVAEMNSTHISRGLATVHGLLYTNTSWTFAKYLLFPAMDSLR